MSTPYVGEIRAFGFSYPPYGWMQCNGQLLGIAQYTTLFAVIGTIYGGDGQATFALPNLQDTAPMHWGNGAGLTPRVIGEQDGTAMVTLLDANMPAHTHVLNGKLASDVATQLVATPTSTSAIGEANVKLFVAPPANANFAPQTIGLTGGSQAHQNMQPFLAVNFCIANEGIFPSRN